MTRFGVSSARIGFLLMLAAILVLCVTLPAPQPVAFAAAQATRSTLRVGMWTLWHDRDVLLKPSVTERTITVRTCAQCAALSLSQPANLHAVGDGVVFTVSGKSRSKSRVSITGTVTLMAHGETVTIPNPVAISARNGALVIAVTLPIESYVERVVASESGSADSRDSLRALALVVRTFALHESHGHPDYDLCDSTHCQLLHWGGNPQRRSAAHAATLATAGETLWFHGSRALAYFNKDCGGHTASPAEIWPRAHAVPYLPSQQDRFCATGDGKEWASEIARADLTAALAAAGAVAPGWQHISVERRGESGRAITLRLDAAQVSAETFLLAAGQSLGWSRIPSTWFEVRQQGDHFLFHGRGWGHGVGLCQKGAAAMAAQGNTSAQILQHYFPGAQPADESTGHAWQSFRGSGFVLESLDASDGGSLPALGHARSEAERRSGLHSTTPITVRAFASASAFREATLAPGWVAAFTEGDFIATQPLRTLTSRHLLEPTMLHEFLHVLVERESGAAAPLWLREGLVEAWSHADSAPAHRATDASALTLEAVDSALAHTTSEAESASAHRAAGWYVARLLDRYGRAQVLQWLHSGIPAGVVATLGQR
jgi:stage II sporulation protein D